MFYAGNPDKSIGREEQTVEGNNWVCLIVSSFVFFMIFCFSLTVIVTFYFILLDENWSLMRGDWM